MSRLKEIVDSLGQKQSPPVHLWRSGRLGSIDICIDRQGCWFHEGSSIARINLVKLFASILWFEDGKYFLVTPVEKLQIVAEDVPFLITQVEYSDGFWLVTTNLHEQVVISQKHSVELRLCNGQWLPYVNIRYDLWARVNRSIYYQWVSQAIDEQRRASDRLLLLSGGYEFEVARE